MRQDARHVAILVPSLDMGGGARAALNVASGLASLGYRVDLVVMEQGGPLENGCPANVQVVRPAASAILGACSRLLARVLGARYTGPMYDKLPSLVEYLKRERPGALAAFAGNSVAALAAKIPKPRCRLVVTCHAPLSPILDRRGRFRAGMQLLATRWFVRRADAVVAVSAGVARDLIKLVGVPEERMRVIYNPVIDPGFYARAGEPADHPWLRGGGMPLIIAIGRLIPEKDFATLIHAFSLVVKRRPGRLMVLGEGPERPNLERLVRQLGLSDHVAMPGYQRNPLKFLKRSNILVVSSIFEGFCNALVEALALGIPVVATDCVSGPREILDRGKFGRLVPVGQPGAMAEAIIETLETHPDPEILRARASEFTVDAALPRYIEALGLPPVSEGIK